MNKQLKEVQEKKHKLKPSLILTQINITFYYNVEINQRYFLDTISLNPYY